MSLDALRKLHAQTVDALKMELAHITQALSEREQAAQTLEAGIQRDVTVYRRQTEEGLAIETLWEWQRRIDAQEAALSHARRDLAALTTAWRDIQARLVAANQERTIVDRYLERRERARRTLVDRREQLTLDEAGQRRHALRDRPL